LAVFAVFDLSKSIVTGFQKFKLLSASNFLSTACIGIATVILGYYYGVYYAILGWAVGYFAGNLINFKFMLDWGLLKKVEEFDIKPILKKYSFPMWGMYLLNTIKVSLRYLLLLMLYPKYLTKYYFVYNV
ncbi:MAG: hypothetical protein KAI55_02985, partial [Candidatus Aenigmarchaeota archaeon]|nr:hypothetical protein [Candidatus Aenigmarchaeota archaeon]